MKFIANFLYLAITFGSPSLAHAKHFQTFDTVRDTNPVEQSLTASKTSKLMSNGAICGMSRVALAPSGETVALWSGEDRYSYNGRKLVKPLSDKLHLVSLTEDKANSLVSPLALEPITWSPDSKYFHVSVAGKAVASIDLNSEKLTGFEIEGHQFLFARISSNTVLSKDDLYEQIMSVSEFSKIEANGENRIYLFLGKSPKALSLNFKMPRVAVSNGTELLGGASEIFALRDLRIMDNGGLIVPIGFGENHHYLDESVPYLSSIFDRLEGGRSGFFSSKVVYLERVGYDHPVYIASPDEVILDVDQVGDRLALLLEDFDGSQRIVYSSSGKFSETRTCDGQWMSKLGAPEFESSYTSINVGKFHSPDQNRARAISYALIKSKAAAPGRLTVMFHGGPLASSLHPQFRPSVISSALTCSNVLLIDGAGTVGAGMSNSKKIADMGFDAFKDDALQVRELVNDLGYDEIHVIGSSFGGISGIASAEIEWPELKSIDLVAPALQILDADETTLSREGLFENTKVDLDGLRAFIQFVYGEKRDSINLRLNKFLADPDPRVQIYMGTEDKEVPIELLPSKFPANQFTKIDRGTHITVFQHRKVTDSIRTRVCGVG